MAYTSRREKRREKSNMENIRPVPKKIKFFSPGAFILIGFMAVVFTFGPARFIVGIGGVTNLTDQYLWGI